MTIKIRYPHVSSWRRLWTLPNTLLGLFLLLFITKKVIHTDNFRIGFVKDHIGAWMLKHDRAAFTLGEVIFVVDDSKLNYKYLIGHELVHVRQYYKYGPLFLILYGYYSLKAAISTKGYYYGNIFEVEAYNQQHNFGLAYVEVNGN